MGQAYWCYSELLHHFFDLKFCAFVLVLQFPSRFWTTRSPSFRIWSPLSRFTLAQGVMRTYLADIIELSSTLRTIQTNPSQLSKSSTHGRKIYILPYKSKKHHFIMVTPPQQNFQPQTRDTTNGPHLHTYIPRSDGTIVVGGVAYVPQNVGGTAVATTVPLVTANAVPVAVQPAAVPLPTVQLPQYLQYPLNSPYYIYQQAASLSVRDICFLFSQ